MVADTVAPIDVLIVLPQPASGKDLQMVPEGERSFDHRKTWISALTLNGDLIGYDNASFKIVQTQKWVDPDTFEIWYRSLIREVAHVH